MHSLMNRRTFLSLSAAGAAMTLAGPAGATVSGIRTHAIPKSGERIPAIGMGTWITFNVGDDRALRDNCADVLKQFFALGGGMVDSSPMYGSAEDVIGYCLNKLQKTEGLFSATKVWTPSTWHGESQMASSEKLWGLNRFDLFQVHNLVNWEGHLETLRQRKAEGRVRYIGITTSHGMRHDEMATVMREPDVDFIQLTYNAADREAEQRLLPMAADNGVAVIANRPFQRGALIDRVQRHPLPGWAAEFGADNWAQVLLKFVISHPAMTCTIPATSKVTHMTENMGALSGVLPDVKLRARIADHIAGL